MAVEKVLKYTLVQHSGYTGGGDPQFRQAVEPHGITAKQAEAVEKVGGLLFDTYREATNFEHAVNYPPGVQGITPRARGKFVKKGEIGSIFVPST